MAEETVVRTVDIRTKGAEKNLENVADASDKVSQSTSKMEGQLDNIPGPLGKVKAGVAALGKAFKALLANPVVAVLAAIVAALAALTRAFTKTQAGADRVKEIMSALGAAFEVVTERAARLFKALGQIVRGNFKEGLDEIKGSVKGVGDELREATEAAVEFERMQRRLFEAETDQLTVNAERRAQIAELVFLTRDLTRSVEERRDALIQASELEDQILRSNIELQQQRVEIAQQEILNTPELLRTREQSRKLAEEEARLIDLQTESLRRQRQLKNRLNELDTQERTAAKAAATEQAAIAAEEEKRLAEEAKKQAERRREEMELELLMNEEFKKSMLELDKDFQKQQEDLNAQTTNTFIQNAQKRFDTEDERIAQQIENEYLLAQVKEGIYQNSLSALLGFLGEGSRIAKAVQVADATRTAIITAMQAYKSAVGIPVVGAVLGPIAAAAALAAGMANVRKIIQTPDPTGAAQPATPSVSLAQPTASVSNADFENAGQGIPTDVAIVQDQTTRGAVKTYVVQSEVSAEQEIARKKEAEASL